MKIESILNFSNEEDFERSREFAVDMIARAFWIPPEIPVGMQEEPSVETKLLEWDGGRGE